MIEIILKQGLDGVEMQFPNGLNSGFVMDMLRSAQQQLIDSTLAGLAEGKGRDKLTPERTDEAEVALVVLRCEEREEPSHWDVGINILPGHKMEPETREFELARAVAIGMNDVVFGFATGAYEKS